MMQHTQRLLALMAQLRHPERGCPWDLQQDFASLRPYVLEEAYEVADAIDRGNPDELREELGDLLLQVVFHARIAEEQALFDFEQVAAGIADKLVRRHPHVFDTAECRDAEAVSAAWERIKQSEKTTATAQPISVLDGVAAALPALVRADKLQRRAARVGFDWPDAAPVFDKVQEELAEVQSAHANGDAAEVQAEIGDLLFSVVNLARHLGVEPESALQAANAKFTRRFNAMAQNQNLEGLSLQQLDALWDAAKRAGL